MTDRVQEYEIHHPSFRHLINGNARLHRLWTGAAWAEGPVYFRDGDFLLFSDIPNNRIMRFVPEPYGLSGTTGIFRAPAGNTNGHTRDMQGRLISCSHGERCLTRTEHDGTITVLADRYQGKRLNSPNDVVVKSDDTIWFTDPSYGILSNLEGWQAEPEYGGCNVFRLDPDGTLTAVATDFVKPNGLAFSPDEKTLYIADTGASHMENGPKHIRTFDVAGDNTLSGGDVLMTCDNGMFDGFRIDTGGRIWSSAADGVHCFTPKGELLGKILVPEVVANVCFGGVKKNRLYICGTTSLYAVLTCVEGATRP